MKILENWRSRQSSAKLALVNSWACLSRPRWHRTFLECSIRSPRKSQNKKRLTVVPTRKLKEIRELAPVSTGHPAQLGGLGDILKHVPMSDDYQRIELTRDGRRR